jgi:hexosaminidase
MIVFRKFLETVSCFRQPNRYFYRWLLPLLLLVSCQNHVQKENSMTQPTSKVNLIPVPVSMNFSEGTFSLSSTTPIYVAPENAETLSIGHYLAAVLGPATGFQLEVLPVTGSSPSNHILLTSLDGDPALGEEGYQLTISPQAVVLRAPHPAGLFWGVQTLRQLLPAAIEENTRQPGPWQLPAGVIRDYPRYPYRGTMLDVSRHFFNSEALKGYIDLLACYKLNVLHLHLSDDQGWRLAINSWPNLAAYGGTTQVGGGPGGYYTQETYAEIVAYARSRYITIVPEFDFPGHTNAALASYPELNCDGKAPSLYTGTNVGFSSLCITKELTYDFLDDVIGELAALTPGPYIHIGGDEAHATSEQDYLTFMSRIQPIVRGYGKQMVGWDEMAKSDLLPGAVVQYWRPGQESLDLKPGVRVIVSPAPRVYLDMKYDSSTPLGLDWAGTVSVEASYAWDPAAELGGLPEGAILGVEAPLWSETLETMPDVEFMAFPRLLGVAEIGWSPQALRTWEAYRLRLASHGPRLAAMQVNYYPSPLVPWP